MLLATMTLVTEIPVRAMLDLEEIGGEGLRDSYATLVDASPTADGVLLIADYEGTLLSFPAHHDTRIPVITYASNVLETATQEASR